MSQEDLAERLDAVERRLDAAYPESTDGATADDRTIERLETFAERLADLEAAVEAVEGYVGEIERVNGELEQRADAAIAAAEGAEERVNAVAQRADGLAERLDSLEARSDAAPAADDLAALRSEIADLDDRHAGTETGPVAPNRDAGNGTDRDGSDGPVSADDPIADTTRSAHAPDRSDQRRCDCDAPGGSGELGGTASPAEAADRSPGGRALDDRAPESRQGRVAEPRSQGSEPPDTRPGDPEVQPTASESGIGVSRDSGVEAPSGGPAEGSRTTPVGRADGGRPGRRGAAGGSTADTNISGWDDPDATTASEPTGAARRRDGDHEDRTWAGTRSETLLDRLRSLL